MKPLEVLAGLYKTTTFFLWSRETFTYQASLLPELGGLECSPLGGSYKNWGVQSVDKLLPGRSNRPGIIAWANWRSRLEKCQSASQAGKGFIFACPFNFIMQVSWKPGCPVATGRVCHKALMETNKEQCFLSPFSAPIQGDERLGSACTPILNCHFFPCHLEKRDCG